MQRFILLLLFLFSLGTAANAQAGAMTLSAGQVKARKGETVCVNVSAIAFRKIISMQYSMQWDNKILELAGVKNFRLPYLSTENFGLNRSKEGLLTFVWIDNTLKGVDLPDSTPVFQLCFKVKGAAGSKSAISFSQKPTPFEVVNSKEQLLQLVGVAGKVSVN